MNDCRDIQLLQSFVAVLGQLNIPYAIGGSLASSIYGKVRFTADADITVEPFDWQAEKFYETVQSDYYICKQAMYQALQRHSSFNLIHLESAYKIDVFIRKDTDFERQLILRRKLVNLSETTDKPFSVVSPEDIILMKLCWYRDGGYSSHRQWSDVLGVLEVQTDRLDFEYLEKWAKTLELTELLEKAVSENKKD